MTRPQIIRADTIDLQDSGSPSAQDHSRQPTHPAPLGIGPAAPHQHSAIKQVEKERLEQGNWDLNGHSLRDDPGSDDESTVVQTSHDQQQDGLAVRQDGGMSGSQDDSDMGDADMDDGLDDDMMDKISSSPSIDDGGYNISSASPAKDGFATPPRQLRRSASWIYGASPGEGDSSPFLSTPLHLPLGISRRSKHASMEDLRTSPLSSVHATSPGHIPFRMNFGSPTRRRQGEYDKTATRTIQDHQPDLRDLAVTDDSFDESRDVLTPLAGDHLVSMINERLEHMDLTSMSDLREDIHDLLLPVEHSILDNSFDSVDVSQPRPLPEVPQSGKPQDSPSKHKPPLDGGDPAATVSPKTSQVPVESPNATREPSPTGSSDGWDTDSDDSGNWTDQDEDQSTVDIFLSGDPRYVDSGWGGECLRDTEDIDFEFVYALHTFVATVEGQANATKGDTMVLLDDSNSYWWLVRVVKDSTIGYLPAEHIETPTERLARLNKHRNIDLSATMLADNVEKTKNPLKKAIRRRNAKNVSFAPPTYVEASDYDYSSDEEDDEDVEKALLNATDQQQDTAQADNNGQEEDGITAVEPLKVNGSRQDSNAEGGDRQDAEDRGGMDASRGSEDDLDRPLDPKVSRNGTMRNTDSFFKDDATETRRINLTPNLLRDNDNSARSSESRERGPSLESLEKSLVADKEKSKEDKRKKEKKPGMLSGLFKRKEKKKGSIDDYSDEKVSEELSRSSPQPKESVESFNEKPEVEEQLEKPGRQGSKGKLQKAPKTAQETSPKGMLSPIQTESNPDLRQRSETLTSPTQNPQEAKSTMRLIQPPDQTETPSTVTTTPHAAQPEPTQNPPTATQPTNPSDSYVHVSSADTYDASAPDLVLDNSPSTSPSLIDIPTSPPGPTAQNHIHHSYTGPPSSAPPDRPAPTPSRDHTASPSASPPPGPVWSDMGLRSYMDDTQDVRDLLLVVHDKSGVVPVGADHPIMAGLFTKESQRIKELEVGLDGLLGDWLERKRVAKEGRVAGRMGT